MVAKTSIQMGSLSCSHVVSTRFQIRKPLHCQRLGSCLRDRINTAEFEMSTSWKIAKHAKLEVAHDIGGHATNITVTYPYDDRLSAIVEIDTALLHLIYGVEKEIEQAVIRKDLLDILQLD